MKEKTIVGKRIQYLRKDAGYTQIQMSELLHVSRTQYGYYETGQNVPSVDMLTRMAEFFHTSIDFIVGRTNLRYMASKSSTDLFALNQTIISQLKEGGVVVNGKEADKKLSEDLLHCYQMAKTIMELWER